MRLLSAMRGGSPVLATAALSIIVAATMAAGPLIGQTKIATAADATVMHPAGQTPETSPVKK